MEKESGGVLAVTVPVKAATNEKSLLNRAYGCFAFLGLAMLPVGVGVLLDALHWMSFDEGTTGGSLTMLFGMVLALPLFVGMMGATIFGIVQAVRFRHPALIALSAVSIVCGCTVVVLVPFLPGWTGGRDSPIGDYGMGAEFAIYIVANISIPAWWFVAGRQRYRSRTVE